MSTADRSDRSDRSDRPNVIIIYADDLGFGDVGCYGASAIPTPNLDRLAATGIRFHDGYATAATCTPSRYSLLTGSYPWRNHSARILPGNAPLIIPTDVDTLPGLMQRAGYTTGVVGKWHLGLGDGAPDWNGTLTGIPNDVGFDYSYIMAATNDRVPCVYVENGRIDNLDPADPIDVQYCPENPYPDLPSGEQNPELLRIKHSHGHNMAIVNGVGRIGFMRGGGTALWNDEEMADVFLGKAIDFVTGHRDQPFFLYYAVHQPHVPRIPHPRFVGATELGPRGDVIVEMDWCVGQLLDALEQHGLRDNTMVIFSSDNGPVLDDGYQDQARELCGDHRPSGPLRGGKYSMYDGGTRVPMILSWPDRVAPGESDALLCHADLIASFAELLGCDVAPGSAPDSINVLPALLGKSETGREELVTEGLQGRTVLRQGDWVLIPPHDGPAVQWHTNTELGNAAEPQLYDLADDIGQIRNQAADRPELAAAMAERLQAIRDGDRTR